MPHLTLEYQIEEVSKITSKKSWKIDSSTIQGSKIKKIVRSPFGDQLEKFSRQMQIFSPHFV